MYECIFYQFTFKIKEVAFSNVHAHSNIIAAELKTTCSHKLDRTEEILQVKQNKTFSFETFLWAFGWMKEHQIQTDHITVSGDLNNQSYSVVLSVTAHPVCRDGETFIFSAAVGPLSI